MSEHPAKKFTLLEKMQALLQTVDWHSAEADIIRATIESLESLERDLQCEVTAHRVTGNAHADVLKALIALVQQIEINDYTDSLGHSAKMMAAYHEAKKLVPPPDIPVSELNIRSATPTSSPPIVVEPKDGVVQVPTDEQFDQARELAKDSRKGASFVVCDVCRTMYEWGSGHQCVTKGESDV